MDKKSKVFIICSLLFNAFYVAQAQPPQLINYQAIARNTAGEILANTRLSIQFTIHENDSTGPVLYSESTFVTSNQFGLFSTQIGGGAVAGSKTFGDINWGSGAKWLEVGLDANGGNNYTCMGISQLLSVPYALATAKTPASQSAFKATQSGTEIGCLPGGTTYPPFSKIIFDDRSTYNNNSATFTANTNGVYSFCGLVEFRGVEAKGYMELGFYINNMDISGVVETLPTTSTYWTVRTSTLLKLKAGDTVQLFIYNGTDHVLTNSGNGLVSEFSGYQLY